jgi:nitroimidazol reductase NimA-like FMN-containing flavoprotein (pyridoxamine 5'-phosphate oxidase superfamily)
VIEPLSRAEIDALLHQEIVGRVGCHLEGRTYVVPVIYAWDGDCVYVQSIEGRKIEMMRANPRVCFEVDEYRAGGSWQSVIVEGTYEELDAEGAARALALLVERFAPGGSRQRSRDDSLPGRKPVAFRIRPEELSGRRVVRSSPE